MRDQFKKLHTAIILSNLGTPQQATTRSVRRYLHQFLSDKRMIEIPVLLWRALILPIILWVRPKKSAALYAKIWTKKGSPLLVYSQYLTQKFAHQVQRQNPNILVELAMRYGEPSIEKVLNTLRKKGLKKLVVLPLYPQYSATTTASTFDAIAAEFAKMRWQPHLHFISGYHDHPLYIEAIARSIEKFQQLSEVQHLLFSYHGLPERNLQKGDPYYCLCQKTTRLVADRLALRAEFYTTTFQSRFGRAEWLKPYTVATLEQLAQKGVRKVALIAPGFAVDCLETLEELQQSAAQSFQRAGGEQLYYIACLNDSEQHVQLLQNLVTPNLATTISQ